MRRIVVIILLFCVGCKLSFEPTFVPELNVFCVLLVNGKSKLIVVSSKPLGETINDTVKDAQIIISSLTEADTITWNNGYNIDSNFVVEPCTQYFLHVEHDLYPTVIGTTLVPDTFTIISPADGDTIEEDYMILMFSIAQNAVLYEIAGRYIPDTINPDTTMPDTPFTYFYALYKPLKGDTIGKVVIPAELKGENLLAACAVDTNFFEYLRQWHSMPQIGEDNRIHAGVHGGIGLFGSGVLQFRKIYIK